MDVKLSTSPDKAGDLSWLYKGCLQKVMNESFEALAGEHAHRFKFEVMWMRIDDMCFLLGKETAKQAAHSSNHGVTGGNNLCGGENAGRMRR